MIFISYRRSTGSEIALLVKTILSHYDYDVFLDLHSIHHGNWKQQIKETVPECSHFIMIIAGNEDLNFKKLEDDIYYFEILTAMKYLDDDHITFIYTKDVSINNAELPDDISRLKAIQGYKYSPDRFDELRRKLLEFLDYSEKSERVGNKNYIAKVESRQRLREQRELFREADDKAFDMILTGRRDFTVLDLGCGSGEYAQMHFLDREGCRKVIGIDISEKVSSETINNPKFIPFRADCEADDFEETLQRLMEENGIRKFDLINMTFLLLHLENPKLLLYKIRKFLSRDGYVFIRDVDDDYIISYPDSEGYVRRLRMISNYCPATGNRDTARQIYSALTELNYRNVSLIPEDFSTANASDVMRDRLFDVNISFIEGSLKDLMDENPNDNNLKKDWEWLRKNIGSVRLMFSNPQYFFKAGIFAFTAQFSGD